MALQTPAVYGALLAAAATSVAGVPNPVAAAAVLPQWTAIASVLVTMLTVDMTVTGLATGVTAGAASVPVTNVVT